MNKSIYTGALKSSLYFLSPTTFLLGELLSTIQDKKREDEIIESLEQMEENANKQEISDRLSESRARVLQELAIARRIETADEVEIEEYFDSLGEGNVGVTAKDQSVKIGLNGNGRKVVKRVYRFKGWNQEIVDEIEKEYKDQAEDIAD